MTDSTSRARHLLAAHGDRLLVGLAVLGLAAGIIAQPSGASGTAAVIWSVATAPVLLALLLQIVRSLRKGDVGLDIVAALSMSAALLFGEPLAANVVALMYAGGQLLENFATGRARKEMTALLGRVANAAMRYGSAGLSEVPITEIVPGDRLLIRQGEVLPVDGNVVSDAAVLDLSALTGESVPQQLSRGEEALSGATSAGAAFDLVASRPSAESTYAGIVKLVEAAQTLKAPIVRLADRYAVGFLVLTVVIAAMAWILSHEPIRALAVLVVATPCPLILAVPVAIISGMSRTARFGVLVKDGGVLETLARISIAVLDKTGTLTHGQAAVTEVRAIEGYSETDILKYAAGLDQASGHVVAAALVAEATRRGLALSPPTEVAETPGAGIEGVIDGKRIAVGGNAFVRGREQAAAPSSLHDGLPATSMTVAVSIDGRLAGLIVLKDKIRTDAGSTLAALRAAGIARIVLASGDRGDIARAVGTELGVDAVMGDLSAEEKVTVVRAEAAKGAVMMVGDGVNDAPALAAADVGVAMGARGTAASSEVAGVVVLVDQLGPLAKALVVARRTRRIALESVFIGLGLSIGAMVVAAFGYLPPVQGALLQEVIDVAVILNALRALR